MPKIRRGTLGIGSAVNDVANFSWNDAREFDRRAVDAAMVGVPVEMKRAGSGSFELLAGNVPSGYATANPVFTYSEVAVANGVETVTSKICTFHNVTFNSGGNVDNDAGPGSRQISFDYSHVVET